MTLNITKKRWVLFLIASLVCPSVLAATVFSVTPLDRSVQYLGMIFGNTVGAISLVGTTNNITLSMMFQNFNFIIVTVGAVVLSYLAVVSTLNTAREGEAMGKKISLWVPLRSLGGMLMMVPGPSSGYSVIQMTVLWIVLNGIGAANSVWNVVLTQLSQNIGVGGIANEAVTDENDDDFNLPPIEDALYANACMYAINSMSDLALIGPIQQYGSVSIYATPGPLPSTPTLAPTSDDPNVTSITQNGTVNIGIPSAPAPFNTICGQFTVSTTLYSNDKSNSYNLATLSQITGIKLNAVKAMFNALDQAAQTFGKQTAAFPAPGLPAGTVAPGYIYAAQQAYLGQMATLLVGTQIAQGSNASSWEQEPAPPAVAGGANSILQNYANVGWIHAGSLYYTMVQSSAKKSNPAIGDPPTSNSVPSYYSSNTLGGVPANWPATNNNGGSPNSNIPSLLSSLEDYNKLNAVFSEVASYLTNNRPGRAPTPGFTVKRPNTGNKFVDAMTKGIAKGIQDPILKGIKKMISPSTKGGITGDPLLAMGRFGADLMAAAEMGILVNIVAGGLIMLVSASASCLNPTPWAIISMLGSIIPFMTGGFVLLWTTGATLGVYTPLIPYLIFTTTAFGWFIAVIEAMLGAPILALGLVHPGGEELGKAGSALSILANIFLRPTLMIFGFVIGATLLQAGIALINFGFMPALVGSTQPSMFSILAVLGLYVYLMIGIVNQAFSLIYMLPNQILRWMGGTAETFDPSNMTKKAEEGFGQGAQAGQAAQDFIGKGIKDKGSAAAGKADKARETQFENMSSADKQAAFDKAKKSWRK